MQVYKYVCVSVYISMYNIPKQQLVKSRIFICVCVYARMPAGRTNVNANTILSFPCFYL